MSIRQWAVLAVDDDGMTVDALGDDFWRLADRVASWAQQEEDRWPRMGLLYMLIPAADVPAEL
jgi:hypothetical protein